MLRLSLAVSRSPSSSIWQASRRQAELRLSLAVLLSAFSQLARDAEVSGRVNDPSPAVRPKVTVEILNSRSRDGNRTATNQEGFYTFPPLNPGEYVVSASDAGFQAGRVENVVLDAGPQRVINLTLQPGKVKEWITLRKRRRCWR